MNKKTHRSAIRIMGERVLVFVHMCTGNGGVGCAQGMEVLERMDQAE